MGINLINKKPMKLHRNSQKRYYLKNAIYFTVSKTFKNFPYFKEKIFCELFIKDLIICKRLKKFKLFAFCLVYDHLNLLFKPNDEFNISKVMKSLKENSSRNINKIIISSLGRENGGYEGDTTSCRLHTPTMFETLKTEFLKKYGYNQSDVPKFKWQKSFYSHMIRSSKDFKNHYHYTIYNFLKHHLPENWQYTSLNYPDLIDKIFI